MPHQSPPWAEPYTLFKTTPHSTLAEIDEVARTQLSLKPEHHTVWMLNGYRLFMKEAKLDMVNKLSCIENCAHRSLSVFVSNLAHMSLCVLITLDANK